MVSKELIPQSVQERLESYGPIADLEYFSTLEYNQRAAWDLISSRKNAAWTAIHVPLFWIWVVPAEQPEAVDHPAHYNLGGVEVIEAIDAWGLGFCLGNAVKYIARAGRKDPSRTLEDLEKARWYLDHEIERRTAQPEGESLSEEKRLQIVRGILSKVSNWRLTEPRNLAALVCERMPFVITQQEAEQAIERIRGYPAEEPARKPSPILCRREGGGEHQYSWNCTDVQGHEGECDPDAHRRKKA